jgi:hypothetical protein
MGLAIIGPADFSAYISQAALVIPGKPAGSRREHHGSSGNISISHLQKESTRRDTHTQRRKSKARPQMARLATINSTFLIRVHSCHSWPLLSLPSVSANRSAAAFLTDDKTQTGPSDLHAAGCALINPRPIDGSRVDGSRPDASRLGVSRESCCTAGVPACVPLVGCTGGSL